MLEDRITTSAKKKWSFVKCDVLKNNKKNYLECILIRIYIFLSVLILFVKIN